MKAPVLTLLALFLAFSTGAPAQTVKDREAAVLGDRSKMEGNTRWIYNDIDAGFAAARETGKPLMVVLRCVPCLGCMGLDAGVLLENAKLKPLMDEFVRVRVINANSLNLSLFQFDYDLSFSTLFFNGDGSVYGRYGSWSHQEDTENQATGSFERALEGALAIHRNYPANKQSLSGKQGEPSRYKTPINMPTLRGQYQSDLRWDNKVVQSCVHCHMIGDAIRHSYRDHHKPVPEKCIYPFPSPDTLGIHLSETEIATIEAVAANSTASNAGLQPGDEILSLAGQPLISAADFSWALHQAPDSGTIPAGVRRSGVTATVEIELPAQWRGRSDISDRVGTWPMRAMAFGGMKLEELTDDERKHHGLSPDSLALFAKHVGQYGKHALAKKAGFLVGDIIIEIDGSNDRLTESELIGHLIQDHRPGARVPATILRKGKKHRLKIPTQ